MKIERILIVDDEILMRRFLQESLERLGIIVDAAKDGVCALDLIAEKEYDVVFTDIKMPQINGIELLRRIKGQSPETQVILMTAYGTIETAVEAMKIGAFDYILKPFSVDQIDIVLKKIIERQKLINENKYLKKELKDRYHFDEIIGKSKCMKNIFGTVSKIATTRATVLIQGDSGTGKELVARSIHYNSDRRDNSFIKLNCAAIPETLMESELFGHEKGSFTGASSRRLGKFELADQGTILLDEISEIPLNLQAKLLRVIQEREFERVGGEKSINVDVRIIATSNRDLAKEVRDGNFREDLYYRLNVVPIFMPPLRQRSEDIAELTDFFVKKYCNENGIKPFDLSEITIEKLKSYSWDGNVRELENLVERSVVLSHDRIILPNEMSVTSIDRESCSESSEAVLKAGITVREMEKNLVFETLKTNCWNKTRTAEMLDISIRTLRNKLNEYRDNSEIPREYSALFSN